MIRTGSPISSTKHHPGARREVAGADDELHGLRNRHEVARHLGVRDGHRAAVLDLAAEDRHDAARRGEHVAEADGDEARLGMTVTRRLDDPFGHRLRGAHHRARVDRLVGRDEHEALGAGDRRGLGGDPGRDRVVAHGLERIGLHQRDVLVGGGVEYDIGLEALHHLEHALGLLAVREHRLDAREVPLAEHLAVDREEVVLGVVEKHEQARPHARDLARELGSDRASGTGDQHDLVLEVCADAVELHHDGVAPEDVLDAHLAQLAGELDAAAQQLEDGRKRADGNVALAARSDDGPAQDAGSGRNRDDHLVGLRAVEDRLDLVRRAQDLEAEQAHPPLARVVVDEPDRARAEVGVELHLANDHLAAGPGADDQDLAPSAARASPRGALGDEAAGHSRAADEQKREHEVDHDDRARERVVEWLGDGEDDQHRGARDGDRSQDQPQVRESVVAPPLLVQAEDVEDQDLAERDEADRCPEHRRVALRDPVRDV